MLPNLVLDLELAMPSSQQVGDPKALCRELRSKYERFEVSGFSAFSLRQQVYGGLSVEPDLEFVLVFVQMLERAIRERDEGVQTAYLADGILCLAAQIRAGAVTFRVGFEGSAAEVEVDEGLFISSWRSVVAQVRAAAIGG